MANIKGEGIRRDQRIEIGLSEIEKTLIFKYADEIGINPTRLCRNLIMQEIESNMNKYITKPIIKAYIKFAEVSGDKDLIERIKQP